MPLSTIQQIQTPDPAGVAVLLRGANLSFNNAFDSANAILGQYQEGQTAKADAEFVNGIASVKNEEELNKLLATGAHLANPNMSPEMLKTALALRNTVLGYDTTRINQNNAVDANSRANAAEGRTQADWVYSNNARDAYASMTPAIGAAYAAGLTYGQPAAPGNSPIVYANQGAVRNDPLSPELTNAMGFLGPMGITMKVFSGGQESNKPGEGTGSTRHNDGNSADAEFYIGDRKLDWNNEADIPILQDIVKRARSNGVTGFGAGNDYMGPGRMHVGFGTPGVWGAGGNGANAPDWLVAAYNNAPAGGATPGPTGYTGGQFNGYMQSPTMTAALAAMSQNPYLTPDQFKALTDVLQGATVTGQNTISARDAEEQALLIAATQNAAILNPQNVTPGQMQAQAVTAPGLNPVSAQKAAAGVNELAAPGGALGGIAAPAGTTPADAITTLADSAKERVKTAFDTDPSQNLIRVLEPYQEADDPVQALFDHYNENTGVLMPDVIDNRKNRETVQVMADKAGVSVAEMAATLSDMTDRNAYDASFWDPKPSLNNIFAEFQSGLYDKPGARAPEDDPIQEAARRYGPGAKKDQQTALAASQKTQGDIDKVTNQIQMLENQIQKTRLLAPNDPRIPQWEAQKNDLIRGLNQTGTKSDTISQKLLLLPPGAPEATAMAQTLVEQMKAEGYPASQIQAVKSKFGIK